MKLARILLSFYATFLAVFITLGALSSSFSSGNFLFFILILPLLGHFIMTLANLKHGTKIVLYYDFILVTVMAIMGFVSAGTMPQLVSALLFCPLAFYFWLQVFPKRYQTLNLNQNPSQLKPSSKKKTPELHQDDPEAEVLTEDAPTPDKFSESFDENRRMFLKIVGSAGLGVLMFSLFSKRASLPFLHPNQPTPGSVALKNKEGENIDPAAKQPTDGYRISEIDDSLVTYFGFIDKTGRWFIMQEGESGSFRYVKGETDFATNWAARTGLTYQYYDEVF